MSVTASRVRAIRSSPLRPHPAPQALLDARQAGEHVSPTIFRLRGDDFVERVFGRVPVRIAVRVG